VSSCWLARLAYTFVHLIEGGVDTNQNGEVVNVD
jgi:hypothetical protein